MARVTDPSAHLERADRLEVRSNANELRRTVDDPEVVAAVCAALAALPDPWMHPAGGIPVATTRLDFYSGDQFVGNLGVASSFLTAQVAGGFVTYGLDDGGTVGRAIRSMVGLRSERRRGSGRLVQAPIDPDD